MPMQLESQQLFKRAIQHVKAAKAPLDENALDVCESQSFFTSVFATYCPRL